MARILAVDWDDNDVYFLLGNLKNDKLSVLKTGTASILPDDGAAVETSAKSGVPQSVLLAIETLLKENRVDKCYTMLVLGRWYLELHHISLPASRESDLPSMARNVMLRDVPSFSELDPIDYITLAGGETSERKLALVTMSVVKRQKLSAAFRKIGRPLSKIEYRGAAAAELLVHNKIKPEHQNLSLVVTILSSEVELTTLYGEQLVAFRSFKIPENADETETTERIFAEIVRTINVALPDVIDLPIETVYIFGAENEWKLLAARLLERSLEVVILNPFSLENVTCTTPPEQPSRFAALLGAAFSAAGNGKQRSAFDLLDPKEKPKPPNIARWVVFAILFLGICCYGLYQWNTMAIERLKDDANKLEEDMKKLAGEIQEVRNPYFFLSRTQVWDNQCANWLDELRDLSILLPEAEDLVITQMTFQSGPVGNNVNITGQILLRGMVRDTSVLQVLQAKLQNGRYHRMVLPVPTRNPAGGGYPWLFTTTIYCFRRQYPQTYLYALPKELQEESNNPVQPAPLPTLPQTPPQPKQTNQTAVPQPSTPPPQPTSSPQTQTEPESRSESETTNEQQ
ncbi:MAG: hypothetical protein LBU65_13310 [Planctomycetaceae bacterium]|jgi:hypothetical protein|nr:hypothetical protein [Planctomycetaceae bacterium]